MRTRGIQQQVLDAILSGFCNTWQDVADETGLSVARCSKCISALVVDGALRWTDRFIPVRNYKLRIFEVANA
jgi:hypothetical protein